MNRLLIVEDEKLIRQCMKKMISNSSISIKEILECRDGDEALKILQEKNIDVLITDICMPNVDGITLVKKIKEIGYNTKVIVASGCKNFNYAVEVLRYGAREYILKPIKEEEINLILQKMNLELMEELKQIKLLHKLRNQQLKYFILNNEIKDEEFKTVEEKFGHYVFDGSYVVCCLNSISELDNKKYNFINLEEIDGHKTYIVEKIDLNKLLDNEWKDCCVGISKEYKGIRNVRRAYEEATKARCEAFIKENHCFINETVKNEKKVYEKIPKHFHEKFVQVINTEKLESIFSKLQMILFKAKIGRIEPQKVIELFYNILKEVYTNYSNIINIDIKKFYSLKQPFLYNNVDEYYYVFEMVIYEVKERLQLKFEDSRNKEKINTAIIYIKENYSKDLNMAVVSNYISMNYSLFSFNFKQFTGINFVNYLKTIRINEAKRMLEETDEKIIDISKMIGYDNDKYFMKTFKLFCGVSPSEYRKNIQIGRKN